MREVFEEDDDYENNSPVLLSVPQLEGPIVFTKEALKNWGWAHIDNSEQSVQFCIQLQEWKDTKVKLHNILEKAYQDTRLLKEHVVSNKVMQDHLYMLHNQVKQTAKQVQEASHRVDQLIGTALKQMMLNVNAIRDFGTLLCAIPFNILMTQDFYCSI